MDALRYPFVHACGSAPEPALTSRPRTLAQTGLSESLVMALALKDLYHHGEQTLGQLAENLALPGSILEPLVNALRREAKVERRGQAELDVNTRLALTERGRIAAIEALAQSGYVGPAPVPLETYAQVCRAQTSRNIVVTREAVQRVFAGVTIDPRVLNQIGPAVHSGRALFIYGHAGTGKSFLARRLAALLGDPILIPHAVIIGSAILRIFDPECHRCAPRETAHALSLSAGHDARYVLCERPLIVAGGELTLDMLDVGYDANQRQYTAPLQLKANGGMLLIDDLGRQRIAPAQILNRWIVPMEEGRDYLMLQAGEHVAVPFDLLLTFSTNLDPLSLADAAFLRRIGYKVRLDPVDRRTYRIIWDQECARLGFAPSPDLLDYLFAECYVNQPMLPCEPRDLLNLVSDFLRYDGLPPQLTKEVLDWAWKTYFVRLKPLEEVPC